MIFDVYELLGRGIIATCSGRSEEGVKYLTLAAKLQPNNSRVWLWLASAEATVDGKRRHLQQALAVDPNAHVAQWLLDHLNHQEVEVNQPPGDFVCFTCSRCGGKQRFDPDVPALVCQSCNGEEPIPVSDAPQSGSDLDVALARKSENWSVLASEASCGACGAKTSLPPDRATLRCPFCDSDLIVVRPATPGLVTPTAIAPFQYHEEDVLERIGEHWNLRPHHVRQLYESRTIVVSAVYLPFWSFDGQVQIRCVLERRVSPATYSSAERVVTRDSWPSRSSWFECDIEDLLVCATAALSEDEVGRILPFDMNSLLDYRPAILAGWRAEHYQMALEDAGIVAHKRMRDVAFNRAAHRGLFMEPAAMLQDDVFILDRRYKLVLLPIFIVKRHTPGSATRLLINGQTGKAAAEPGNWLDQLKKWF